MRPKGIKTSRTGSQELCHQGVGQIFIHIDTGLLITLNLRILGGKEKTVKQFSKSDNHQVQWKAWLWCGQGEKRHHKPHTKRGFYTLKLRTKSLVPFFVSFTSSSSQKYASASFCSAPQKCTPFQCLCCKVNRARHFDKSVIFPFLTKGINNYNQINRLSLSYLSITNYKELGILMVGRWKINCDTEYV